MYAKTFFQSALIRQSFYTILLDLYFILYNSHQVFFSLEIFDGDDLQTNRKTLSVCVEVYFTVTIMSNRI